LVDVVQGEVEERVDCSSMVEWARHGRIGAASGGQSWERRDEA
jgi:hypothetical protein